MSAVCAPAAAHGSRQASVKTANGWRWQKARWDAASQWIFIFRLANGVCEERMGSRAMDGLGSSTCNDVEGVIPLDKFSGAECALLPRNMKVICSVRRKNRFIPLDLTRGRTRMWLLGMDVGTGGTRAVVVDGEGKLIAG